MNPKNALWKNSINKNEKMDNSNYCMKIMNETIYEGVKDGGNVK